MSCSRSAAPAGVAIFRSKDLGPSQLMQKLSEDSDRLLVSTNGQNHVEFPSRTKISI